MFQQLLEALQVMADQLLDRVGLGEAARTAEALADLRGVVLDPHLHPGVVATNFISHASPEAQEAIRQMESISAEDGAKALVWLATGEEPGQTSGQYFHLSQAAPANQFAMDDGNVERLWAATEKLVAVG